MTKKIISLILVLVMLLTAISCGGNNDTTDENTTDSIDSSSNESVSETDTSSERDTYNGTYKVGYARVDITPEGSIPLNTGDMLTKVKEKLYATCVAVSSGDNTVLLYSLDIKNMSTSFDTLVKNKVKIALDIPFENVIINTMHNHSAPCTDLPSSTASISKWRSQLTTKLVDLAKEAVADLSDAEPYIGQGKTTNLAFVRRYIHEDGTFSSIHYRGASKTPIVKHETEADDVVQVIRFVREDKKDVVMANWQAHVAHAIGAYPNAISGDYVYHARKTVEDGNDDALFAFYLGAAGNINLTVKVKELNRAGGNYAIVGRQLGKEILATLDNMTPVSGGEVEGTTTTYKAKKRASTTEEADKARLVKNSGYAEDSDEYNALLDQYGFKSKYEVNAIINHENASGTQDMLLGAITVGDISFVSVPYEMFDTNGQEIKQGSPYKMTFVLAFSGGAFGYIPSAIAVSNGGYEVYTTHYEFGTAEKVVSELLGMLESLYNK